MFIFDVLKQHKYLTFFPVHELECIGLVIEQHLLKALLIEVYHVATTSLICLAALRSMEAIEEAKTLRQYLDILLLRCPGLD